MPENTENEKLYLAADSGGSKTLWVLITASGEKICEWRTEGLGAVYEGILPVKRIVSDVAKDINSKGEIEGIYLSLGGPNTAEVLSAIQETWKFVPAKVEREACGDAILQAVKFFGCSAVVMCGTGSTAVGNTSAGRRFAGGWGPVYGDGGSGGGLGTNALRLFLKSVDGIENIGELSTVFSKLTDGVTLADFEGRMEVKRRANSLARREIAAFVPEIYRLSLQNNKTACELFDNAAQEIASMAYAVSENTPDFTVLLCGGFFAGKPEFVEMCREKLAEKSNAKIFYCPEFSPIVGAEISVLQNNNINVTKQIFEKIWGGQYK